jgi:hypothetical protein
MVMALPFMAQQARVALELLGLLIVLPTRAVVAVEID